MSSTEHGKPSVGAQIEGVASVNSDAREPAPTKCIKGRCYSPIACGGFGYCRDRNYWNGNMIKSFDPKCHDLAEHFLSDEPELNNSQARNYLASHIQEEAELWMSMWRRRVEAARTADGRALPSQDRA